MVTLIFENEFVRCELDDSIPVLVHRWLTAPSGREFKSNLLRILEEFKKLKPLHLKLAWLADTTLLDELDEETEHWLVEVWEDLLFAQQVVRIHAVILGHSIFADYPMEKFKLDAEQKFKEFEVHLGVFSNNASAFQWIKEQQQLIA